MKYPRGNTILEMTSMDLATLMGCLGAFLRGCRGRETQEKGVTKVDYARVMKLTNNVLFDFVFLSYLSDLSGLMNYLFSPYSLFL